MPERADEPPSISDEPVWADDDDGLPMVAAFVVVSAVLVVGFTLGVIITTVVM